MDPNTQQFINLARQHGYADSEIFNDIAAKEYGMPLTKGMAISRFDSMSAMGHPTAAQATTQALQNGADPNSLSSAKQKLGDQSYIGYCEAFTEQVTVGHQGIWPSAISAWNGQQDKAVQGLDGVQPGDAIYFAPDQSNSGYGHTGVYSGDNRFVSATDNGVQETNLNDWQNMTGQQILGYIPHGGTNGS